jgi:hypothetical protein
MAKSIQFYTLATLALGKNHFGLCGQDTQWALESVWMLQEKEMTLLMPGIEP